MHYMKRMIAGTMSLANSGSDVKLEDKSSTSAATIDTSPRPQVKTAVKKESRFNPDNVLVVPDLHAPFELDDALAFVLEQQERFDCGQVVFIGDIVDLHAMSYHEHNADGMSAGAELKRAIKHLEPWYRAFPVAKFCLGNHDRLPERKIATSGLPSAVFKGFRDVMEFPDGWSVAYYHEIHGVIYQHGTGRSGDNAYRLQAIANMQPTVMGHTHTSAGVQHITSRKGNIWGMGVGCLIDSSAYAFGYMKEQAKRPVLGCGVVLDRGKLPIFLPKVTSA